MITEKLRQRKNVNRLDFLILNIRLKNYNWFKLKEDFCELCLLIIGSVQQLVQQNQSESEILAFIDKNLCGRLGPLNGTCVGIVEVEGKAILDELTSNKTVCCISIFSDFFLLFIFCFSRIQIKYVKNLVYAQKQVN